MDASTPLKLAIAISSAAALGALSVAGGATPAMAGAMGAAAGVGLLAAASRRVRRELVPSEAARADPVAEAVGMPDGLGRDLLERLPLGLLLLDRTGRILFENPAARDVLERSVMGMNSAAALRAPALVDAVGACLTDGRAVDLDASMLRSSERVVHAFIRPLADPAEPSPRPGAPTALIMLEDRTALARAETLRRDFVANASHELKTPLASISGAIETLLGPARDDPAAHLRFLRMMETQAERMRRLVEDLLSLNRIEVNEYVRPRAAVDLAALAREAVDGIAPMAANEGATVEVDLPERGLVVIGDHAELSQVMVNLLENAVKYASQGGPIRVALADEDAARPGMIGVAVRDSGPGIAREHVPRLTERFYRVSASRSRERGGTGLGLAIAKHILNRHRGDLAIASTVGKGSTFAIWLPRAGVGASRSA